MSSYSKNIIKYLKTIEDHKQKRKTCLRSMCNVTTPVQEKHLLKTIRSHDSKIIESSKSIVSETLGYLETVMTSLDDYFNELVLDYIEIDKSSLFVIDDMKQFETVLEPIINVINEKKRVTIDDVDDLISETPFDLLSLLDVDQTGVQESMLSLMISNFYKKSLKSPLTLCKSLDIKDVCECFGKILPKTGCLLDNEYVKDNILTVMITTIFLYTCVLYFYTMLSDSINVGRFDTSSIVYEFLNKRKNEGSGLVRVNSALSDYERLFSNVWSRHGYDKIEPSI